MPPQFIYTMYQLKKIVPSTQREILRGITLAFYPDAKIGVLGPNGAGKSTLLRIMAGVDRDFVGDARITEGYRPGLLAQEPALDPAKDVRGNVLDGVAAQRAVLDRYNELSLKLGDDLPPAEMERVTDELQRTQDQIEAKGLWDLDATVDVAMDALRCPPGDQDVATLSGGERRRVALCRLLLSKPDLLLLDEPTNHLDADSVGWLERHLAEYPGCVVAVTHDRYFLDNVAGWILELDKGAGIPYQGNYSSWLEQKRKRLADEEKQESARQRTLARELEWVRASPRARQAKSKARIEAYERLLAEDPELRERELEIFIPPGPRLGDVVAQAEGIRQADGDKLLSGGERNRVHLAKLLRSGGNVLLLDEPTNDLDVDTLRALEEAILDFAGCVVVISHDRWFLDRVATHMLVFESDSRVEWFEGNYQAYEEHMRKTVGTDWRPHRIRYRPLMRA